MVTPAAPQRYHRFTIAMHWLMVLLLIATATTMELRGMYPKGTPARELIKSAHYALGLAVFVLVWVRLMASLSSTTPAIEPAPPHGNPCWATVPMRGFMF